MRKFFILFFTFVILLSSFVYADEAGEMALKIADSEKNIRNAASIDVDYEEGMLINYDFLDVPVQAAIEKKKEYVGSEEAQRKDLRTDIVINLKGVSSDVNLLLDTALSDYSAFIDNIIINANGIYCFISPSEFSVKKSEVSSIYINIKDEEKVVAKYNGTAQVYFFKITLLCLFVFIAVYILFFILFYIRKTEFREGFNVKIIYWISGFIAVLCFASGITIFIADGSSFAEKALLSLEEENVSFFTVDFGSGFSNNEIHGIYLGIPNYNDKFNVNILSACRKSDNQLESDKTIGGNYLETMGLFKFPIATSGSYYMINNSVEFEDVNSSDEGLFEAISILSSKGILNGKADNIYGVDDTVTRAESVTMFCKMLNIDEKADSSDKKFEDIETSDWFFDYVMAGKKYGILSGYNDNTFRANNTITRQEFAAVLGQIMQNRYGYILPNDFSNLSVYNDKGDIAFWAESFISLLQRENINIWQENYLPKKPITRGEAAIMIYRAYCLAW